jgi:hypothetical protein
MCCQDAFEILLIIIGHQCCQSRSSTRFFLTLPFSKVQYSPTQSSRKNSQLLKTKNILLFHFWDIFHSLDPDPAFGPESGDPVESESDSDLDVLYSMGRTM